MVTLKNRTMALSKVSVTRQVLVTSSIELHIPTKLLTM